MGAKTKLTRIEKGPLGDDYLAKWELGEFYIFFTPCGEHLLEIDPQQLFLQVSPPSTEHMVECLIHIKQDFAVTFN
ncbi:hypothetical protein D3C80_2047940 [compost metagenome]